MTWQATARAAVAHLRKRPAGTGELAHACNVERAFLDDALAPLVDAGKLMRINAFRNGGAEFDYRFSATWVPGDSDFELCRSGGHAPVAAISPVAPATPSSLAPAAPPFVPAHVPRPALTNEERIAQGHRGAAAKNARAALDRALAQSPQSLGWAPALDTTDVNEEKTMPTKSHKPRATTAAGPQLQLCTLLIANGDLALEDLRQDASCDDKALANAIRNAKSQRRIEFIDKSGKYRITAQGRAWASGGANRDKHKAATPKKPASNVVAIGAPAPVQVVEERSFRCAVYSDGGFHLAKAGQAIDLTAAEHAQMLRYLERMAEQQA